MAKSKTKGHEAESCGFRIVTEACASGFSVVIYDKPRTSGVKPRIVVERDGFEYEGQALDWGLDWAMENRPYSVVVKPDEDGGFRGKVLNESGFDDYSTTICSDEDEARTLCDAWVTARRRHDQEVLKKRRELRANHRMLEADIRAAETEANAAIDAGKGTLKKCEKEREKLLKDLEHPQIDFNFVSELERQKVEALRGLGPKGGKGKAAKQTDITEHIAGGAANDPTSRARGSAQRAAKQDQPAAPTTEAPTP